MMLFLSVVALLVSGAASTEPTELQTDDRVLVLPAANEIILSIKARTGYETKLVSVKTAFMKDVEQYGKVIIELELSVSITVAGEVKTGSCTGRVRYSLPEFNVLNYTCDDPIPKYDANEQHA